MFSFVYKIIIAKKLQITISKVISLSDNWVVKRVIILLIIIIKNNNNNNNKSYNSDNHNYNKIVKSDWLSTALISTLIGQFNRTVRVMLK